MFSHSHYAFGIKNTDELIGNNPEFGKRLKYTREIMAQLISGNRR